MTDVQPGVIVLEPRETPGKIAASIRSAVAEALADVPPDARGALVTVVTEKGANVVFGIKGADDRWKAEAWIGKDWRGPVAGGVTVTRVFR